MNVSDATFESLTGEHVKVIDVAACLQQGWTRAQVRLFKYRRSTVAFSRELLHPVAQRNEPDYTVDMAKYGCREDNEMLQTTSR